MAEHAADHRIAKHAKEEEKDSGGVMSNIVDTASEYVESAKEYVSDSYEAVTDKAGEIKKTTEKAIKKNPWVAVGVALGVGVVLGMLIKSSRN